MSVFSKKNLIAFVCCGVVLIVGCFFYLNKSPTVSVVMPVYNRADLVERAIRSILSQTFKDFELIIVDDGSTDNTRAVLNHWSHSDRRIRVIGYRKNQGIAYARQYGLKAARGEFVAIMDSDDVSFPNRLEMSVRYLRDHPDVTALSAQVALFNDESAKAVLNHKKYTNLFYEKTYRTKYTGDELFLRLIFNNIFQNTVAMFRRDFVRRHHISYNTKLISAEDYDFWASFLLAGAKMTVLDNPLGFVRKHHTNTERYYEKMKDASNQITQRLIRHFFEPTQEEGRYWPEPWIQCHVLKKIKHFNASKKNISKQKVHKYYKQYCPNNWESGYFLMHTKWNAFLIFDPEEKKLDYTLMG